MLLGSQPRYCSFGGSQGAQPTWSPSASEQRGFTGSLSQNRGQNGPAAATTSSGAGMRFSMLHSATRDGNAQQQSHMHGQHGTNLLKRPSSQPSPMRPMPVRPSSAPASQLGPPAPQLGATATRTSYLASMDSFRARPQTGITPVSRSFAYEHGTGQRGQQQHASFGSLSTNKPLSQGQEEFRATTMAGRPHLLQDELRASLAPRSQPHSQVDELRAPGAVRSQSLQQSQVNEPQAPMGVQSQPLQQNQVIRSLEHTVAMHACPTAPVHDLTQMPLRMQSELQERLDFFRDVLEKDSSERR